MVCIYRGDTIKVNLDNYNRNEFLYNCQQLSDCEKRKFLFYKDKEIVGGGTYQDILNEKFNYKCIQLGNSCMLEARDYFVKNLLEEYSIVPVVSCEGECVIVLQWINHRVKSHLKGWDVKVPEINVKKLTEHYNKWDGSILTSKDVIIIWEIEEYTKCIIDYVIRELPYIEIICFDEKCDLFYSSSNIKIMNNVYDIENYIADKSYMVIKSNKIINRPVWKPFCNEYDSYGILRTITALSEIKSYGKLNADKTIVLLDSVTWGVDMPELKGYRNGLGDIVLYCCAFAQLARDKGYIPIVCQDSKEFNQYVDIDGVNMWDYYFVPFSDITKEEALQSKNVISLKDSGVYVEDSAQNIYACRIINSVLLMNNKNSMFNKMLVLKKDFKRYADSIIPEAVVGGKCLGVVMRGTDKRRVTSEKNTVDNMIKRVKEICLKRNYEYVFLATEENEFLYKFQGAFSNLLYIDMKRVDYETDMSINIILGEIDRDFTSKYLATIYALSKCRGLIGSCSCGAFNIARMLNDGKYEICVVP